MARSITDARQVTLRSFLQQIANATSYAGTTDAKPANQSEVDNLLAAINDELTPLLRLSANSPNSLIVNVGAATIVNSESSYTRSIPHIGALLPNTFASGTITFPSASGGNITTSTGSSTLLTVASGNFIKVLTYMDSTGALNVLPGVEAASIAAASVIAAPTKTLPIGYILLQNIGGVIQAIPQSSIYQFGTGSGGSGSGTGSGIGDDLASLQFKASFTDDFSDIPTGTSSPVDTTAGKTDSTLYSAANTYFRLAYDATKTVTGTGTAMTMSSAPGFTVKIGDMLRVGAEAKRITAVASQTSYTIESAFATNPTAAASTVSQAVYTKDVNNFVGDGQAISTAFSTTINSILVNYEDTTTLGDVIFDANTTPVIAYTATADGTTYSPVSVRPTNLTDQVTALNLAVAGTTLFLRFFANNTSGSGFVNILGYKTFLHRDSVFQDGSLVNQASTYTNGSGTPVNVAAVSVVSGKTRIQKTWSYPVGVNPNTNNGALIVTINGQKVPRFVSATANPDAYYKEIDQRTIELDNDYSSLSVFVEVVQTVAVVDASDTNTTNISQSQESTAEAFQGFVKTSQLINSTTATGTPAAGTFHSIIVNRAAITDLSQDLRARMGIDRIQTQQIIQLQNEFGPNGEPVFSTPNDTNGQIRFVGGWSNLVSNNGQLPNAVNQGDFIEITFYGTGLNCMFYPEASVNPDIRYNVDGGSISGASIFPLNSGVLSVRNYNANTLFPVVSGLSLGVHTVKLIKNASNGASFTPYGFEIINDSSTIRVNPGSSYLADKKMTSSIQNVLAYNSAFETGTIGTRGGHVLIYQKSDGSIAKAVNPANASSQTLTSTDHTNEEIARTYNWREFGAGRSDDFSFFSSGGATNAYFALDDGTTTLVGSSVNLQPSGAIEIGTNGGYLDITFVGTGLDIIQQDRVSGGSDTYNLTIDGGSNIVLPTAGNTNKRIVKLVSGLPYGTHNVRIARATATTWNLGIHAFIVYQPKKPSLPAGAIELADYNIMATYVANTTAGLDTIGTGVLRKTLNVREAVYIGTWAIGINIGYIGSAGNSSSSAGAIMQYTFFGTGFELRGQANVGNATAIAVKVDGVTPTGVTTSTYGGWAYSAGNLNQNAATQAGAGFSLNGLALGLHTVTFTVATAASMFVEAFDVITPIHSAKSITPFDLQNNLPIGSCAISDNRKTSAIKDSGSQIKSSSKAIGVSISPSTTSTTYIPCPDLSTTIRSANGGKFKIGAMINWRHNATNGYGIFTVYLNGVQVGIDNLTQTYIATADMMSYINETIVVGPGVHKIDIYWRTVSGTVNCQSLNRNMTVEEI